MNKLVVSLLILTISQMSGAIECNLNVPTTKITISERKPFSGTTFDGGYAACNKSIAEAVTKARVEGFDDCVQPQYCANNALSLTLLTFAEVVCFKKVEVKLSEEEIKIQYCSRLRECEANFLNDSNRSASDIEKIGAIARQNSCI